RDLLCKPDISGQLSEREYHSSRCHRKADHAGGSGHASEGTPYAVEVAHGERVGDGYFVGGIQAPRPDAAKAVAVGEEIEQLSVGAPGRLHFLAAAIRNRDPSLARHGKSPIEGHHE